MRPGAEEAWRGGEGNKRGDDQAGRQEGRPTSIEGDEEAGR